MKIKDVADARKVADQCIEKLVAEQSLVYFSILFAQEYSASNCFFSPTSDLRGEGKKMLFVDDIEKVIKLLLSHPKVSDLEYDEKENMISATFQDETPVEEEAFE
jgi:hypothetical protein